MEILVIEDDRRIASFLERGLTAEGHHVSVQLDGRDGLEAARNDTLDLVILDRTIPYIDGLEVCRILRQEKRPVLILMLTAKDELQDKIDGLRTGADDYLTKPFAFDELLARIDAMARRRGSITHDEEITVGPLSLDPGSRSATRNGEPLTLTVREFDLLRYLMQNAGRVVSRERLLNSVWRVGYDPGTKIVDVYIRYLRAKIDLPSSESMIQTVRGIGYMMPKS
ncbi:MAG: response regulator transcription factor [Hyphomicrobiales bacterium]|nr:MAG: response regulator transcription factor [Hyphomicrobiales bacterium]